jgi:hypothetical protein
MSSVMHKPFGRSRLVAAFLLVTVLLTACAFSPEQAAIRALLEAPRTMQVKPATIRVLQTQSLGDEVNILILFNATQENGQVSQCLFLYEAYESRPVGWVIDGSGGGCGPVGGSGESIGIGAGQHSGSGRPALSHVKGLVHQASIQAVEVIWDDGEHQHVEVVNDSYLAVRGGLHEYVQLQALNEKGEVICTHDNPPPAPDKESYQHSTNLPVSQPTNLPIYQSTNLPVSQPTNLPIYQSPFIQPSNF